MMMETSLQAFLRKRITDEIVVFPTDTVYGIGCRYTEEDAIERIYAIKKREKEKPLAILCADIESARLLCKDPSALSPHAERHWPGPLTLVVEKSERVPLSVTRGKDTVGIRIPAHKTAQAILERFGPMAVTSLNESHEPPVLRYDDALAFSDRVDCIVEGEDLDGTPSTVYDTIHRKTLRKGDIDIEG